MNITLGNIDVEVVLKDIKNVHLSVHPPVGRVRIAAPNRMDVETIRLFAISKLGWIKDQQRKLTNQQRETPREFLPRETHFVWGRQFLMTVFEANEKPSVSLGHDQLVLTVRPGATSEKREQIIEDWYRDEVKTAATTFIQKWEPEIGVEVVGCYVQRMKTRWGSCNSAARTIRLNTDLAKKPPECLEYIVVHEMIHILEPTHNERFRALMSRHMPDWTDHRETLNSLPVRYESWDY